jgi:signal transduction histidine kinase
MSGSDPDDTQDDGTGLPVSLAAAPVSLAAAPVSLAAAPVSLAAAPVSRADATPDGATSGDGLTLEALEALDAAITAIAGEVSLEGILQVIADRLRPLVGARYAALGIVGPDRRIARFISSGLDGSVREAIGPPPRGHGILGLLITEQRTIRIDDVMTDPRRAGFPSGHPPMHSFLGVPVVLGGRPVGNLYLTEKIGAPRFSEADQRLVETFAHQAAMAIHTARLHDGLARLVLLQERERIGRDLHDGIIQSLYGVGLTLEDVPDLMAIDPVQAEARVDRAIDAIHATIRDIRGFIFGLRTEDVETVELAPGLERLSAELARGTTMTVTIRVLDEPELDPSDGRHVLQLAREALSNAARHAGATRAEVDVEITPAGMEMRIADDGRGFDPAIASQPGHQGIGNMRSRALSMGGTLDVVSTIGAGTTVTLRIPGVSAQQRRSST